MSSLLPRSYACYCIEELLDTIIYNKIHRFIAIVTPETDDIVETVYNKDDEIIKSSIPESIINVLSFPITILSFNIDGSNYGFDLVQSNFDGKVSFLHRTNYVIMNMLGYKMLPMVLIDLTSPFFREEGEFKHHLVTNTIYNYFDALISDGIHWLYFIPDEISQRYGGVVIDKIDNSLDPLLRARITKAGGK